MMVSSRPSDTQIIKVKNTFIDIQDDDDEHLGDVDLNELSTEWARRGVSGPATLLRQLSEKVQAAQGAQSCGLEAFGDSLGDGATLLRQLSEKAQAAQGEASAGRPGDGFHSSHFRGPPPAAIDAPVSAGSVVGMVDVADMSEDGLPPDWCSVQTVMMRNLPNKYSQRMLLDEVDKAGFFSTFDFLYLPIDPETGVNRGYAFINFTSPHYAWMFKKAYEGRKMRNFSSSKVVGVMPAALQGFQANYGHYSTARVNRGDPSTRPLFLREPSPSAATVAAGRRGRRRRGGGASAIDVAARQSQRQRQEVECGKAECQQPERARPQERPWPRAHENAAPAAPAATAVAAAESVLSEETPPFREAATPKWTANFCPHCGEKVQPHFLFCCVCGGSTALNSRAPPPLPGAPLCDDSFRQKSEEMAMGTGRGAPMYYMMPNHCFPGVSAPGGNWKGA